MLCHHFLYNHLDGTQVDSGYILDPHIRVTKQVLVGAAGNAIATASVGSFSLAAAISIAFVQVLWMRLAQRSYSTRQIRTFMDLRTSPFAPSAWHAWGAGRSLRLLAVLGMAMTLITIFAPSSLRTVPFPTNAEPCTVSKVNISGDGYDKRFYFGSEAQQTTSQELRKMVARNILGGTYLSPTNPYNRSCSYTLTFEAPATSCTNVTSQYDFSNMVKLSDTHQKQLVIWNSTHDISGNGSSIWLTAMGGADVSSGKSFQCDVYIGTYSVDVTHNGTVTTVEVLDVKLHQLLGQSDKTASDYNALQFTSLTLGQMLCGLVNINVDAMIQVMLEEDVNNVLVLYSTFGAPLYNSSSVPWLWNPDLSSIYSNLKQNISISLLSNPLGIPMIDAKTNYLYPSIIYSYNRPHLALTYGLGLLTRTSAFLPDSTRFLAANVRIHWISLVYSLLSSIRTSEEFINII